MTLQLEHVFAGIGMRRGKEEREALVEDAAVGRAELRERGHSGLGYRTHDIEGDRAAHRAGNAHDANAPAARGGSDGGDRLAARAQRRGLAFASASIVRLMCHCCTIDSRFWQTQ